MNFNLLLLLFLVAACGVKGDPVAPKGAVTPSLLENYDNIKTDVPLNENKRK